MRGRRRSVLFHLIQAARPNLYHKYEPLVSKKHKDFGTFPSFSPGYQELTIPIISYSILTVCDVVETSGDFPGICAKRRKVSWAQKERGRS